MLRVTPCSTWTSESRIQGSFNAIQKINSERRRYYSEYSRFILLANDVERTRGFGFPKISDQIDRGLQKRRKRDRDFSFPLKFLRAELNEKCFLNVFHRFATSTKGIQRFRQEVTETFEKSYRERTRYPLHWYDICSIVRRNLICGNDTLQMDARMRFSYGTTDSSRSWVYANQTGDPAFTGKYRYFSADLQDTFRIIREMR